ncbi:(2Fe-2S)-binding protein [Roseovarius sp. D22-M7]|uniref:(2Fe-2S)-binding protein n=1 Tax=Roseovarius sp. D22-M7 TaxID=3127116 RepID=UPI0030105083
MSLFRRTFPAAASVTITVDGRAVTAHPGDTVATAMLAAGYDAIGANGKTGAPSAPFCLIGVCFGCQCSIDGAGDAQACLVPVRDGMVVETPCPFDTRDEGSS